MKINRSPSSPITPPSASYYRTGVANFRIFRASPDLATTGRSRRAACAFHGAGGNIGAGKKYNERRSNQSWTLAQRLALGNGTSLGKRPALRGKATDVGWTTGASLSAAVAHLSSDLLEKEVRERDPLLTTAGDASRLAWLRRCQTAIS